MSAGPGWFGESRRLREWLRDAGADLEPIPGAASPWCFRYKLEGVASGYGGEEAVVSADALYFVKGEPHSLAQLCARRSGGSGCYTVIS